MSLPKHSHAFSKTIISAKDTGKLTDTLLKIPGFNLINHWYTNIKTLWSKSLERKLLLVIPCDWSGLYVLI